MTIRTCARTFSVAAALLLASHMTAVAADTVRVAAEGAVIRAEPNTRSPVVLAVSGGTVLEVTGRSGDWYRVLAPPDRQGTRVAGYILARQVAAGPAAGRGAPAGPSQKAGVSPAGPAAAKKPSRFTVRGFGIAEYERFQAWRSFDAIFGNSMGVLAGGGVELSIGTQMFVQGRAEYSRRNGERAFVFEGEVFRLGLRETVTLIPVDVTVGYRFATRTPWTPYVGGGIGLLRYAEDGQYGAESVRDNHLSYHAAGGLEFPVAKWLAVAGEVQYRTVPKVLGPDGIGAEFGESNLGGVSACVKVLFGRQPPRKVLPPKPAPTPPRPAPPKGKGGAAAGQSRE